MLLKRIAISMVAALVRFVCLMLTAHSKSELVGSMWAIPVTYRCQRCGATVSFV